MGSILCVGRVAGDGLSLGVCGDCCRGRSDRRSDRGTDADYELGGAVVCWPGWASVSGVTVTRIDGLAARLGGSV